MYLYHSNYILLVFKINCILLSVKATAFKMWIYFLKNISARENDQLCQETTDTAENIIHGCFFQWQSYDNSVIIPRNEILISYIITQEDKYGAQFSPVLFIRDSVNIFISHLLQDSGYTWAALFCTTVWKLLVLNLLY